MICIQLKDQKLDLQSISKSLNAEYIQFHQFTAEIFGEQSQDKQIILYLHFNIEGRENKMVLASLSQSSSSYNLRMSLRADQGIAISKEGAGKVNLFLTVLDEDSELIAQPLTDSKPQNPEAESSSKPKPKRVSPASEPDIPSVLACLKSSAQKIKGKIEKHFPGRRMKLADFVIAKKSKKFKKK